MRPYTLPLVYTLAAVAGLVMALLYDEGVGDALGLVLVALPLWPLLRAAVALRRAR